MALTKQEKQEAITKLQKIVKESSSLVFANFDKLTVAESMALRRSLRSKGVGLMVSKKSLANKVLSGAGFAGSMPEFQGQMAIAYSSDPVEPARGVYEFQKKLENRVSIAGGVFEGQFTDKIKMSEIAQIPSRQTLYAQFVNLINSPIQGFVMALDQIAKAKPQV